jgi:hypothetical protein
MISARQESHSAARQLAMALDSTKLRGMTAVERKAVIVLLANMLREAAGTVVTESTDDDA